MLRITFRWLIELLLWLLHPFFGLTAGLMWLALQLQEHTGQPWILRTTVAVCAVALLHVVTGVVYDRVAGDEPETGRAGDDAELEDERPLPRGRGELEAGG